MQKTDIEIPFNLADKDLLRFFQGWKWIKQPNGLVSLDFRQANFLSPWAITFFASYALWLRETQHKKVRILVNESSIAGDFLCRTGFRELLGEPVREVAVADTERTAKLARITKSIEIPNFASQVMNLLQIEDSEIEGAVKYSLVELLRNVVQHSESPIGGIAMAQYYPTTGLVELVVADMGVGIRATLNTTYPEIDNDLKALKFATQPHVSRTFSPGMYNSMKENAGLGLFFIKQIVSLSGGGFFLGSGKFIGDIWGDKKGVQQKLYRQASKGGWPGTFAVLQLRRDTIAEFDSVLHICREMAEEARKDPAEFSLDFLNETPDLEDLVVVKIGEFEENVEEAARVRDTLIEPTLSSGKMVVLDFQGIRFATQSFVHALVYKILRDSTHVASGLSIANCTDSTREAILAVAGYARVPESSKPKNWNL